VRSLATTDITRLAQLVRAHPRGAVVAGWGARADADVVHRFAEVAGWPVFADPLSQLRTSDRVVSTYDALARTRTRARPDIVLRVGAPVTSKVTNAWLREVPHILVDPDDVWMDPDRTAYERVVADADALFHALADELTHPSDSAWLDAWSHAERVARSVIDACDAAIEGCVARDVAAAIPTGGSLVVASSVAVRALEWCMAPRTGLHVFANRGANGIDGFNSTVAGIARTTPNTPSVALSGDLCFLHDTNGLAGMPRNVTLVVFDNDGGGIFSHLPQHGLPEFERLFATPHGLDVVAVARAHGVVAERVAADTDWRGVIDSDVNVAVVPIDRDLSLAEHRALFDAVVNAAEAGERVPSFD
jgi:2-succinyl-5-enolpyruvyl-6-hydroxy-3-cyclohexene-1-carboxylate synthase